MYHLRLPNGQELTLTSREDFARAVQSGTVDAEALIHSEINDRWVPICFHPDFVTAQAGTRPAAPEAIAEEQEVEGSKPAARSRPSGTRPRPVREPFPGPLARSILTTIGSLALGGASFIFTRYNVPFLDSLDAETTVQAERFIPAQSHRRGTHLELSLSTQAAVAASASTKPAAGTTTAFSLSASVAPEAPAAAPAARSAPAPAPTGAAPSPREPQDEWQARANRVGDDLASLGAQDLMSPARLATVADARAARRTLEAVGNAFTTYRVDLRRMAEEGNWSAVQRRQRMESFETEQIADSLTATMGEMLDFLVEHNGRYRIADGNFRFDRPDDAARVDGFRQRLARLVAEDAATRSRDHLAPAPPMTYLSAMVDELR